MIYSYEINDIEIEFEPKYEEVKEAIIDILDSMTTKEIYSILEEVADAGADLEEYFYDELYEYFEEIAWERYEEGKQAESDLYYDYYHDKL